MTFLHNSWYMAAWADEIEESALLARRLLGEPIILYRAPDGSPVALLDRCPHRFAPLSMGKLENGALECRYHGLRFGRDGLCVANPHGAISQGLKVRSYPVVEAFRAIWIWMGAPVEADPKMIRDLSFLQAAPETAFNKGYVLGRGHYQLFVDNILDLSHTDYLHPDTLGGGSITRTPVQVFEREGGVIAAHWHCKNEVPTPLNAKRLPAGVDRVDSWTEVEWSAPGVLKLVQGAVAAGAPRDGAANSINAHIVTPETDSTTHYFFAATRDFQLDDQELNREIQSVRAHIFSTEDEPMIAGQQARIETDDFWAMKPVLLAVDRAAALVRRRMDRAIAAERTSSLSNEMNSYS